MPSSQLLIFLLIQKWTLFRYHRDVLIVFKQLATDCRMSCCPAATKLSFRGRFARESQRQVSWHHRFAGAARQTQSRSTPHISKCPDFSALTQYPVNRFSSMAAEDFCCILHCKIQYDVTWWSFVAMNWWNQWCTFCFLGSVRELSPLLHVRPHSVLVCTS